MHTATKPTLVTLGAAARAVGRDPKAISYRIERGDLAAVRTKRGDVSRVFVDLDEVKSLQWRTSVKARRERKARAQTERRGPMLPDATRRQLVYPEALKSGERACAGKDPEMFFGEGWEQVKAAKAVCAQCPVLEVCRTWGILREEFGTFGAMTARERAAERRRLGVRLMAAAVIR